MAPMIYVESVKPGMLSREEMAYVVERSLRTWGHDYTHRSIEELNAHIERVPGSLVVARLPIQEVRGSLVTYTLNTGGDPKKIPDTAEGVRRLPAIQDADTRLLYTLESYIERQGVATELAKFAQEEFKEEHMFTYTPHSIIGLHRKLDAKPVHVLPFARRKFTDPHVVIMSYRENLPALTDEQIEEIIRRHSAVSVS